MCLVRHSFLGLEEVEIILNQGEPRADGRVQVHRASLVPGTGEFGRQCSESVVSFLVPIFTEEGVQSDVVE